MISWDKVNCSDVEYMARVIGKLDNNPEALMNVSSYWQPRPYFEFPMPCSTAYNITVYSRNAAGESEPSSVISGVTGNFKSVLSFSFKHYIGSCVNRVVTVSLLAPCAPQNVRYSGNTQSAVLSWDASVFATRYTVYNVSGESRVKLCNTTGLSCQLTNFTPATTEVTASNAIGESNPSQSITGQTQDSATTSLHEITQI